MARKKSKRENGSGTVKKNGSLWYAYKPVTKYNSTHSPIVESINKHGVVHRNIAESFRHFFAINALTAEMTDLLYDLDKLPEGESQKEIKNLEHAHIRERKQIAETPTLKDMFDRFIIWKYETSKNKVMSEQARTSDESGIKFYKELHDRPFKDLTNKDYQPVVSKATNKYSTVTKYISVLNQTYKYAIGYEGFKGRNEAEFVEATQLDDSKTKEPVPKEILQRIINQALSFDWNGGIPEYEPDGSCVWHDNTENEIHAFIVYLCYTGRRISESVNVKLSKDVLYGGLKTKAGKDRAVPVHPYIACLFVMYSHFFSKYINRAKPWTKTELANETNKLRKKIKDVFSDYGLFDEEGNPFTPHNCRYTFESLCERGDVKVYNAARLIGHSDPSMTTGYYGTADIDELKKEIAKLPTDPKTLNAFRKHMERFCELGLKPDDTIADAILNGDLTITY